MQKISRQDLSRLLLGIYSIALAIGAFMPRPGLKTPEASTLLTDAPSLLPALCYKVLYLDGLLAWTGNVIMFIPLLLLLHQSFPRVRMRSLFIICFLATAFIELLQIFIVGRVCDIRDIFVNCLGAFIAIGIIKTVRSTAGSDSRTL
jgi:hypothetical protein